MPQGFPVFDEVGVYGNTGYRTYLDTLGLVKMADAFGAFAGVDFVDFRPQKYCFIGALGLAHIAVDAFVRNDQRHGGVFSIPDYRCAPIMAADRRSRPLHHVECR